MEAPATIDDRKFNRLAIGGIAAGFLLIAIGFAAAIAGFMLHQRSSDRVDHTYQVVDKLAQIEISIERSETASRGYLVRPAPMRLNTYRDNIGQIEPAIEVLGNLTSDNPSQQGDVASLSALAAQQIASSRRIMALASSGDLDGARALFSTEVDKQRVNGLRAIAQRIRAREQTLLGERSEDERISLVLSQLVLIGTGLLMTLLAIEDVWITAEFTENNLGHLEPGSPVGIVLYALPGRVFQGRVHSIGRGVSRRRSPGGGG